VRHIFIALALLLFFCPVSYSEGLQEENWMCGQDFNGDNYFQEEELAACRGDDHSLCPIGAVSCVAEEDTYVYDAEFNCPENYTYNELTTYCEKTEESEVIRTCPSGYSLDGEVCEKIESHTVVLSCPDGYSLDGTRCEKTDVLNANRVCAAGYSLNGNVCERTIRESFILGINILLVLDTNPVQKINCCMKTIQIEDVFE